MSITGNEVSDVKPKPIKTENTDNEDEKIESNSEKQNERYQLEELTTEEKTTILEKEIARVEGRIDEFLKPLVNHYT
ncbi:hypothetical protein AB4517_18685 [Vibrio sp. 10N.222.52.C3]|uniref:hypothetical protein n=1 Tax=Vibrio sp. 10N.222.52.C3 TaxID=3229631 RepID=UPI00354BF380